MSSGEKKSRNRRAGPDAIIKFQFPTSTGGSENRLREDILTKRMEELKFFLYSVIHDLKQPAIALYFSSQRLVRDYSGFMDEQFRKYCEFISRSSLEVGTLIEALNLFMNFGEMHLKIESVNIKQLLKSVKEEYDQEINTRRINWIEPSDLPVIMADRVSMTRVFRNFVGNSIKHGGEQLSEIVVDHRENGSVHIFSVSDNGPGVKGGDYTKIFEAFFRKTQNRVPGAGLGLAIVKNIAEKHKGSVWAEPRSGGGTSFYVSINKRL